MSLTGEQIGDSEAHATALLASVTASVDGTQAKLGELSAAVADAERETASLTAETGPALVAALVQVKEAAAQAAQRAREAIETIIPQAAGKLSEETRTALERVIREIDRGAATLGRDCRRAGDRQRSSRIRPVDPADVDARAKRGRARSAIEQTDKDRREKESEAFARRVSLLIDSMNSAAIDVGKILSDEIDDKAWSAYLKGNRGVFTSRAVRLIGGSETRALRAHYDTDIEFQRSVNRYVHDFEEMLHRVLNEREGGSLAVTLMTSDMGKLYAALGMAIEKKR